MAGNLHVVRLPELGNVEVIRAVDMVHSLAKHRHETFCIGIIERGVRECVARGSRQLIGTGQINLLNPEEIHACRSFGSIPYSYTVLSLDWNVRAERFGGDGGRQAATPYFKEVLLQDSGLFAVLQRTFAALLGEGSTLEKQTFLSDMLHLLLTRTGWNAGQGASAVPVQAIRSICEYLEEHFAEEVGLEQLSRVVHISPYHLNRIFSAVVGAGPHAFQNMVRIRRAKQMLLMGQAPAVVAASTGFVDQSHFSRRFRDFVGMPPGMWVKSRLETAG